MYQITYGNNLWCSQSVNKLKHHSITISNLQFTKSKWWYETLLFIFKQSSPFCITKQLIHPGGNEKVHATSRRHALQMWLCRTSWSPIWFFVNPDWKYVAIAVFITATDRAECCSATIPYVHTILGIFFTLSSNARGVSAHQLPLNSFNALIYPAPGCIPSIHCTT